MGHVGVTCLAVVDAMSADRQGSLLKTPPSASISALLPFLGAHTAKDDTNGKQGSNQVTPETQSPVEQRPLNGKTATKDCNSGILIESGNHANR